VLFWGQLTDVAVLVMLAYTTDCIWRNRDQFIRGQEEIKAFLTKKYAKEQGYRLKKELFAFQDNKIVSCKPSNCSLVRCTDN
jgi:nuclear transport factor 2 (NTF2) superfamily protein